MNNPQEGREDKMSGGTEAALLKVGVAVIQRAAPAGLSLIKAWFKGKMVLVVGQSRAGKSTFIDYFQYGFFEDEKETFKTDDETPSARFNVKVGRDAALELSVQTAVDVPGQVGPTEHANLVFKRRPHAVIVVLDLTTPSDGPPDRASATWLSEFCKRLDSKWRAKKKRTNRIKSMIVMMNKKDKIADEIVTERRQEYRKILDTELRDARGEMLEDIAILPTALVTNSDGTKSVDSVIAHLAKALTK